MPAADADESVGVQSIYQVARILRKSDNTLFNCVHSCLSDRAFVNEIRSLYPDVPVVANLRCGAWYVDQAEGTCYFKSTDGHNGNWSFSTTRLNWHIAELASKRGGVIIVDATRSSVKQGYPDAFNKTVPIWACVLNRAVERVRLELGAPVPQPQASHMKRIPSFTGWLGEAGLHAPALLASKSCSASCVSDAGLADQHDDHLDEECSDRLARGVAAHVRLTDVLTMSTPAILGCSTQACSTCGCTSSKTDAGGPHSPLEDSASWSNGSRCQGLGHDAACSIGMQHQQDDGEERHGVVTSEELTSTRSRKAEWDTSLHLPLWISNNERQQIEARLDGFVDSLMAAGADVIGLSKVLIKPLRPLWISQTSRIWIDQVAQPSQLPFSPLILLSASAPRMHERRQRSVQSMQSSSIEAVEACSMYTYIPGAGDDEESWAHGLTPELLALHQQELEAATPESIAGVVKTLIARQQTQDSQQPQTTGSTQTTDTQQQERAQLHTFNVATDEHHLRPQGCNPAGTVQVRQVGHGLFALGSTRIFLGAWGSGAPPSVWDHVDAVLNVSSRQHAGMAAESALQVDDKGQPAVLPLPTASKDAVSHDIQTSQQAMRPPPSSYAMADAARLQPAQLVNGCATGRQSTASPTAPTCLRAPRVSLPDPFLAPAAQDLVGYPSPSSQHSSSLCGQGSLSVPPSAGNPGWTDTCSRRLQGTGSYASILSDGSDIITVCSLGDAGMGPNLVTPCSPAVPLSGRFTGSPSPLSRMAQSEAHAGLQAAGSEGPAQAAGGTCQLQEGSTPHDKGAEFEFASSSSMTDITPANYISLNLSMPDEERARMRQQMKEHDLEASQPPTPTRYCLMPWAVVGPHGLQRTMYGMPMPAINIQIQGSGQGGKAMQLTAAAEESPPSGHGVPDAAGHGRARGPAQAAQQEPLHSMGLQPATHAAHQQTISAQGTRANPPARYLWLPIASSKLQRTALTDALAAALEFLSSHLAAGHQVLIHDDNGLDQCVCVALALLLACYAPAPSPGHENTTADCAADEPAGSMDCPFWVGPVTKNAHGAIQTPQVVSKHLVRRRLALLSSWVPHARPTRGMLKQVFNFFHAQE